MTLSLIRYLIEECLYIPLISHVRFADNKQLSNLSNQKRTDSLKMSKITPPSTPKSSAHVKRELTSPDIPHKGCSRKIFKESRDDKGRVVISLDSSESEGDWNEWWTMSSINITLDEMISISSICFST